MEEKLKQIEKIIMVELAIAAFNYESVEEFKNEEPTLFELINKIRNILNI